ncbi:MAG: CPXCG motif-containing cysteine-rich protein [Proteobacteria bacterium]|nr:CPXCG motif-containing cysteine-rich protein [Pseudomonadota bacterium]MDA0993114.1 CPXCG motif-containing cysteine-rich protein [Pseudomonadota bacterium]
MDYRVKEKNVRCPFCAESISVLLDLSVTNQSYIEDCQVCCRPMQIIYESENGQCTSLQVECAS